MLRLLCASGLAIVVSMAVGCSGDVNASSHGAKRTVSFTIDGMMCEDACAKAVQQILSERPGVQIATVDYEAKTATLVVDADKFDSDAAIAELEDKEFTAVLKK